MGGEDRDVDERNGDGAVAGAGEDMLTATDVSTSHCRLLLTDNVEGEGGVRRKGPALLLEILMEAEKAAVRKEGGGLPVLLVDRRGRRYQSARLKTWRGSESTVLIGKWVEVLRRNELDPGDVIDVYLFRYDGGVGLVVCARISAREEERRSQDCGKEREPRQEEKADRLRWYKRHRSRCT